MADKMVDEEAAPPRRRAKRRVWTILPPLAVGLGLLFLAASNPRAPAQDATPSPARVVRVVEAEPAPITPRAVGFGAVEPARSWSVAPQVAGRIAYVSPNFVRGGVVDAGEVIIKIEDADYQLAADQARADILSAEAQIEELRLNEENLRRTLAIEQESQTVAERELQRQRDLVARGVGTQAAVDTAERTALTGRSSVLNLENQIRLIPAQISALESSKAVAEAKLSAALLDIERVEIRAPFDGRVAEASAEVSQFVAVGGALGSVDGVESAEITAYFPAATLRNFARLAARGAERAQDGELDGALNAGLHRFAEIGERFGLRAVVRFEIGAGSAYGVEGDATWPAQVLRISDQIDPETRAVGVIVAVRDPYGQARAGERPALIKGAFLRVELYAAPSEALVLAPRAALRRGPGGATEILVAAEGDVLARREIELVATLGDVAAIGAGLAPGDRVIITDIAPAIVGERLRPVLDADAAARLRAAAGPPNGAEPQADAPGEGAAQ